ncbi:hypothetical protein QTP70_011372 [Hemibagrus guttatus]|uniref:CCHC-type domain-containing protein n=1 Tax=Hemibagrus guttatus TaxID=175788 RepID=A0AAE0UIG0_9TELE|nr:hypothetical protein QTP70_011372 [Hemibagrus guttatus]
MGDTPKNDGTKNQNFSTLNPDFREWKQFASLSSLCDGCFSTKPQTGRGFEEEGRIEVEKRREKRPQQTLILIKKKNKKKNKKKKNKKKKKKKKKEEEEEEEGENMKLTLLLSIILIPTNLLKVRESFRRTSGEVQGRFSRGSGEFQENFRRISGAVQENFRRGSGEFQEGFRGISGGVQGNFKRASEEFQESFRGISGELQENFRRASDGFDYVVFTTTGKMRCLCCGKEGHLVTNCPDRTIKDSDTNSDDKISEQAVQRLAEVDQAEAHPVVEPLRERRGVDESAEAGSVSADNVDTGKGNFCISLYRIEESVDFYENLPQLTEEANAGLKGAVSMGELHKALQSMKTAGRGQRPQIPRGLARLNIHQLQPSGTQQATSEIKDHNTGQLTELCRTRFGRGGHLSSTPGNQQDNAPCHKAEMVQEWFDERNNQFEVLTPPPNSPDLNPIHHLWDVLDKQVQSIKVPPHNLQDLKDLLLTSWCQIPQHTFRDLVESMPRRLSRYQCPNLPSWIDLHSALNPNEFQATSLALTLRIHKAE